MSVTILSLILISILSGCANTPVSVVSKQQTVVVSIPDPLLEQCTIDAPPDKDTYLKSSWPDKENSLSDYIVKLLKNLANCNTQLKNAKDFQDKQKTLYSGTSN